MIGHATRRALGAMGLEVRRAKSVRIRREVPNQFVSLRETSMRLERIPGMISPDRGEWHYLMAYSQSLRGDVVELGSWQGRNTCYLAAACRDSGNGIVHAVDHFRGNVGMESHYIVSQGDLSDLEVSFTTNIARAGLDDWVQLHPTDSATVEVSTPVRLLFIDAEHTYEAVTNDLARFLPLVLPGGLVIFDDYSRECPAVVRAVGDWLEVADTETPVQLERSLVVKLR